MSQQIQITGGAKVRDLQDVIIGTSGVLSSVAFNVANGVPKLDSNGKILVSQLPNSVMEYLGTWNAATNTPTLANGTGNQGDVWLCTTPGTVNFGAGPITFIVGDSAIYSGSIWQRSGGATGSVTSVGLSTNGGAITIGNSPITTSGTITANFNGTNLQYVNGAGNLTTFPTLITSIGLSMPSAFSVANSPLTANGTIAVTGAGTTAQYIRGDGSLATFPTIATEAQRLITEVYNETGATLSKGTVVYINGGHGNLPTITKALATGDATSAQTYGIVQTDITNMNNGYVVVIGSLTDLDTSAYVEGTQLYLSSTTAGAWTSVKQYAPAHLVYVAIVTRSHPTQGVVEVMIQNGFEMDELHNVSAQSPLNNQGLFYNTSTSLWENKSIATALGYTPISLTSLSASSPLSYNNTTGAFSIQVANTSQNGYLSSTDWNTFNSKENNLTFYSPLVKSGSSVTIPPATSIANGYLTSTDWSTFNSKQAALSGTGFVKISGTTISYDNSTYYLASNPNAFIALTALSAGVGISYNNTTGVITNSAPDQTVSLTAGAGISVSGTYPSFTIASTITQYTDALARASLSFAAGSGAYNSTTGVITIPTNNNQITNGAGYITGNQTITLSGDVSGSGTTAITTTIGALKVTNAMLAGSIDLTTKVTGLLPDGNISSAATWNAKQNAITLTTTGTSGAATLVGATLNIPQYTDTYTGTVTSVAALTIGTTGTDLSSSVANSTTTPVITLNVPTASATNRGVLSSADWTTFNNKQSALTNPVLASGTWTSGYLPKINGTYTIGNSLVYDDGTNVGIGTTSLVRKLTVSGSGVFTDGTNDVTIWNDGSIGTNGNLALKFNTNGTLKATLSPSGNLGLGVTPSAWSNSGNLDFDTYVSITSQGAYGGTISNNAYYNAGWKYKGANYATQYQTLAGEHRWLTAGVGGAAGAAITFTQAMTLTASGRLLLGTTTESTYLLDVNGTGRFSGQARAVGLRSEATNGYMLYMAPPTGDNIVLYDDAANTRYGFFNETDGRFDLMFSKANGAATFSSSVTAGGLIKSSLYLEAYDGTHDLYVNPAADFGLGALPAIQVASNHGLQFATNNGLAMYITASRNVLIGTTTDAGLGKVQSSGAISVYSGGDYWRMGVYTIDAHGNGTGGNFNIGTNSNDNLVLFTNNTTRLTIANSGAATFSSSVTNTSGMLLNVGATGTNANMNYTTFTNGVYSALNSATPSEGVGMWSDNLGNGMIGALYNSTASSLNLVVRASSSVSGLIALKLSGTGAATFSSSVTAASGIINGTTDAFFDINRSASGNAGRVRFQTAGTDEFEIGLKGGVAGFHITKGDATELVTVLTSGNVGIGTTSPYASLQVNGASTSPSLTVGTAADVVFAMAAGQELAITANGTAPYGINFQGRNSLAGGGGSGTSYPIIFNPLGGNVGIGTSSPNYTGYGAGITVLSLATSTTDKFSAIELVGNRGIGGNQNGLIAFINNNVTATVTSRITGINGASNVLDGELTFETRTSAGSLTERMRITSGGQVSIGPSGTVYGTNLLNVNGGIYATSSVAAVVAADLDMMVFQNTGATYTKSCLVASMTATGGTGSYFFYGQQSTSTAAIKIFSNGNIQNTNNSYGAISDARLKENIKDATPKLDDLMKVKVRNYNLKGESNKQLGVISQELEAIFPNMIEESTNMGENMKIKGVKYSVFVPMLIKAVQEQQQQINELKQLLNK